MSTLSGIAAKGEKGKQKYQCLNINNLYLPNRGESFGTHQHKNTSSRRHGMQSLGKVPSARRAPANLPSLKSEYSGNDPAVSLVPSGGTGWGSKPGETGPPPPTTQSSSPAPTTPVVTSVVSVSASTSVAVTTSTFTAPPSSNTPAPIIVSTQNQGDKSWSSVTSSGTENAPIFLAHQSPYFQQEFPSLSGEAGATSGSGTNKSDPSHLPGPSLRPQTEGSWMQGGSRPQGQMAAGGGSQTGTVPVQGPLSFPQGLDAVGGRSSLVPSGVAGVPAGLPHHYRLMPQFMIRHNQPPSGFPPNYQTGPPRLRFPHAPDARLMPPNKGITNSEQEEITSRPIIKEEDLKVMDEISRDTGWAAHDEIDYNQTLSFSDEEAAQDDESKAKIYRQSLQMMEKQDVGNKICLDKESDSLDQEPKNVNRENTRESLISSQSENREPSRAWQQPQARCTDMRPGMSQAAISFSSQAVAPVRVVGHQGPRQGEDEEVIRERRRLQNEEIAIAVERAKQRKEEEEKRYEETRQAAARKLQMLEEKLRSKGGTDKEESSSSPPLSNTQHGSNTLLPDWEKDKEKNRSRTSSENKDEKSVKDHVENYRNSQGDNRSSGRERDRDAAGQFFSRQFQINLPPRFQKQAAERPTQYYRQNSGGSPQPPSGGHPYEMRWPIGQSGNIFGGSSGSIKTQKICNENDNVEHEKDDGKSDRGIIDNVMDKERFENGQTTEEHVKEKEIEYRFSEEGRELEKKPAENKSVHPILEDSFEEDDSKCDSKLEQDKSQKFDSKDRLDRPQRPDSRDSRTSRDSRNSRDSIRDDNKFVEEPTLSRPDSAYEFEQKEDLCRQESKNESDPRRDIHIMQSYHQRIVPGPITKEKLEASELRCETTKSVNLIALAKSQKHFNVKKIENQWVMVEGSCEDAWQQVTASPAPSSECWPDVSRSTAVSLEPSPDAGQEDKVESQVQSSETIELNKITTKTLKQDGEGSDSNHKQELRRDKLGRGGNRGMRHEPRGPRPVWGNSYFRGASWRGESKGRRTQQRRPNGSLEWGHSESEASADEVSASTESGKEEKHQGQEHKSFSRFPKQGAKKPEKDERMKDNRKIENETESYSFGNDFKRNEKRGTYGPGSGFEPRGEPSRRGRGNSFRSKGSFTNVGRRIDGYGPPTSKRPFMSESPCNIQDDKRTEYSTQNPSTVNKDDALGKMNHDERMKLNQQQLSAVIIGNSRTGNLKNQPQNVPPRMRNLEAERRERKPRDTSGRGPRESFKTGSGSGGEVGDECWETTSEASEQEEKDHESDRNNDASKRNFSHGRGNSRQSQPNRSVGREKRRGCSYDKDVDNSSGRSLINGGVRMHNKPQGTGKEQFDVKGNEQCDKNKQSRIDTKDKRINLERTDPCNNASVVIVDDPQEVTVKEDQTIFAADSNGFQEVRSKKNVKEANRQLKEEPQKGAKDRVKLNKPQSSLSPGPPVGSHSSTLLVNKGTHEQRPRAGKLAPRFLKLKENSRLQKIEKQHYDVSDQNKINQGGASVFPNKDLASPAPPPAVNAWDKPITAALRTSTPPSAVSSVPNSISVMVDSNNIEVNDQVQSTTSSQRSSPNDEKTVGKLSKEPSEKAVLDGSTPPVQTIIFENTNYKSAPMDVAMKSKYSNQLNKNHRSDKVKDRKLEEDNVSVGFKAPGPEIKLQETKSEAIQMPISFSKNEDNADMKLDFRFDSDLSQLTEDKTSKNITVQMTRSIQMAAQSSTADLQFKLESVKKVWENPPAVLEHGEDSATVTTASAFTPTFGNSVEPGVDSTITDDSSTLTPEGVYNSGQTLQNNPNTFNGSTVQNMIKTDPSSNVCKVKPQPQATMHPHPGPLSPPTGAFTSSPAQPSHHINYQMRDSKLEPKAWVHFRESDSQKAGLNPLVYTYHSNYDESWHKGQPPGADPQQFQQCRPNMTSPAQYGGIPAVPSPPTAYTPQPEIYPTFQINSAQVIGNQGRSQVSQFTSPYMSQNLSQTSGFIQQSMYHLQTAPPNAAPPEMFQTQLSQYHRIQPSAYGTSQQLSNNPNTVLISSSTNSLMSASVKPSPQPIGAIGTKGASFQTPSQPPPSQLVMYPDPQLLNQSPYQLNSQLVQRPANNVVPNLPPSSSYYSPSTGGGATGYYQPGGTNIQAAAQSMHQTTFGMQGFNTQSPAAAPAGMGSFGSNLPRLILQAPGAPPVGGVGSRVLPTAHRSNSPAPPRATTNSPRINKMSHRQSSS